jgi:hypothetical protein
MTLLEMSREKALDIVFDARPYLPTDWAAVMADKDDEDFPEAFAVGEPYCGRSNDYVRAALLSLQGHLYSMAQCTIAKAYELASSDLSHSNRKA